MGTSCASVVDGVLAFNSADLIANGFIPSVGEIGKGDNRREIVVLPADRIAVEFQYSVRASAGSTVAGGGDPFLGLGGLGGGLGANVGQFLGSQLTGDFSPTESSFIWHLCDSETRINRPINITEEILQEARDNNGKVIIELPDYFLGILAVTRIPIEFTDEEIESIGSAQGARGWTVDGEGRIGNASFEDFKSDDEDNGDLFDRKFIDERKYDFRGDNYLPSGEAAIFHNNGSDDLVENKIEIIIPPELLAQSEREFGDPLPEDRDQARTTPLIPGDSLYVTYSAVTERRLRQALWIQSYFFLFPFFTVERVGQEQTRVWNMLPFTFKVRKDHKIKNEDNPVRATVRDLLEFNETRFDPNLTNEEKERRYRLEDLECQRIIETVMPTTDLPYVKGFYFADNRGIVACNVIGNVGEGYEVTFDVMIPKEEIPEQQWFQDLLDNIILRRPGFVDLELVDPGRARIILQGFLFDVSDHVNALCLDSEKYGYQRQLAEALANYPSKSQGIGFPNLDLIRNNIEDADEYDLLSAKFENIRMSSTNAGAYFVRECNSLFNPDSGLLQADMFVRTPFFFDNLTLQSRVYLERFSPQLPLSLDGSIWVLTNPADLGDRISADEHPYKKISYLSFHEQNIFGNNTLRYHIFKDHKLQSQLNRTIYTPTSLDLNNNVLDVRELNHDQISVVGYDGVLGSQPGYNKGREISVDSGKVSLNKINKSDIYNSSEAIFQANADALSITFPEELPIKKMKITYKIKDGFLEQKDRTFSIIMPNQECVIDNVSVNFTGYDKENQSVMVVDMANYSDTIIRLSGSILAYMEISSIELIYFKDEEAYNSNSINTSVSSLCFDRKGNLFIFYEDLFATIGFGDSESPNLEESQRTEISCLYSHDEGKTWFDFKGIVKTYDDETIGQPYAFCDKNANIIHLFFMLEDSLMHTSIYPSDFKINDAFKTYKRPLRITGNSPNNLGVDHFTKSGQKMRSSPLHPVIASVNGEFLSEQINISRERKLSELDSRVVLEGDGRDFQEGFASGDYFAYQDKFGTLIVVYSQNGDISCRISNNEGKAWEEVAISENPILFHRNTLQQEPRRISKLGGVYDDETHQLLLGYIVDSNLFVKKIDGNIMTKKNKNFLEDINIESGFLTPIFISGALDEDMVRSIASLESAFIFPYPFASLETFDDNMKVSDLLAMTGYSDSTGKIRMFYRDSFSNLRGFTYDLSKIQIDVRTSKRGSG